jgi:AraC-like DNA-binding protein
MNSRLRGQDYFEQTGLPLSVFRVALDRPHHLHSHDFTELVVVIGGRGLHSIDENTYQISVGDVFAILGRAEHAFLECEGLEVINIIFDMSKLQLPMNDIYELPAYHALFSLEPGVRGASSRFHHHLKLSPSHLDFIKGLLFQINEELTRQRPGYRGMAVGMFTQAIVFLSRCYALADGAEPRKLLQAGKALSYIEAHLADPISLDQLLRVAETSGSTLQRLFRQALGKSPVDYIIHRRFERALELLRHTDLSITEVAFQVGFSDSNYFSRQFKQRYHCSPKEFRKAAEQTGSVN